jgi:thiamine biosynthesis lipoprotein
MWPRDRQAPNLEDPKPVPGAYLSRSLVPSILPAILAACSPGPEQQVALLQGSTMGTGYSIQIPFPAESVTAAALHREIEVTLERINGQMSTYLEDSELSRFNADRSTDWFPVSAELAGLVGEALQVSELTGGAFDPTVGPLVNLWGFGPHEDARSVPTDREIEAAAKRVGFDKLSVREEPPALKKSVAGLYLDLSAMAKGYGVDRIAGLLDAAGIGNYLVEIGGEVRGRGHNRHGRPWRIAVERPDVRGRAVHRVLELRDGGMATSGDYRNFFERDGTRYSHTIDPETGRPVTHALASVTVLAPDAARADALATAFMVLGPDAGMALADSLSLSALFIVRSESGFADLATAALQSDSRRNR